MQDDAVNLAPARTENDGEFNCVENAPESTSGISSVASVVHEQDKEDVSPEDDGESNCAENAPGSTSDVSTVASTINEPSKDDVPPVSTGNEADADVDCASLSTSNVSSTASEINEAQGDRNSCACSISSPDPSTLRGPCTTSNVEEQDIPPETLETSPASDPVPKHEIIEKQDPHISTQPAALSPPDYNQESKSTSPEDGVAIPDNLHTAGKETTLSDELMQPKTLFAELAVHKKSAERSQAISLEQAANDVEAEPIEVHNAGQSTS